MEHFCGDSKTIGRKSDRGAILILSALIMILMLLIAAFATDLGAWYRQGQEQQRGVDVASLNGVQAYDGAVQAFFADEGVSSWAELSSAQQVQAETDALEATMNAIVGVLSATGTTVSGTPTYNIAAPPSESSISVTADDGSVITITRTIDNEIIVTISRPGKQYFSSVVRDAPTITKSATAVLSNCGATCILPIVLNPPFQGFSAVGDGDGFGPLLYRDETVWSVNHRRTFPEDTQPGRIVCMDRATEEMCTPQGEFSLDGFSTINRPVEHIDEARGKIFFGARRMSDDRNGVACFDVVSRGFCATSFLDLWDQAGPQGPNTVSIVGVWPYGNNIYVLASHGELVCVNPDTMAECGRYNTAAMGNGLELETSGSSRTGWGEIIGSKFYIVQRGIGANAIFHCWDLASNTPCWGGTVVNISYADADESTGFIRYNTAADPIGICVLRIPSPSRNACVSLTDASVTELPALNALGAAMPGPWGGSAISWEGKRTFVAGGVNNKIACWNWGTNSMCGVRDLDPLGNPQVRPYGFAQVTPNCIIGNGDSSIFFSFNPIGMTACVDTVVETQITPCQCADGTQKWGVVEIPPSLLVLVDQLLATVTEPDGTIILEDFDLLAAGGWMDLGNADPTVPYLNLRLDVESKLDGSGEPLWTEPITADLSLIVQPTLAN